MQTSRPLIRLAIVAASILIIGFAFAVLFQSPVFKHTDERRSQRQRKDGVVLPETEGFLLPPAIPNPAAQDFVMEVAEQTKRSEKTLLILKREVRRMAMELKDSLLGIETCLPIGLGEYKSLEDLANLREYLHKIQENRIPHSPEERWRAAKVLQQLDEPKARRYAADALRQLDEYEELVLLTKKWDEHLKKLRDITVARE